VGRTRNALKYGCFGCLALAGGMVLILVLLGVAAWWQSGKERIPEHRALTQSLPSTRSPETYEGQDDRERFPGFRLDDPAVAGRAGRVELRLRAGSFRVEPGPEGSAIEVEASFDRNRFRLEQSYETGPDGGWTYHLEFGAKGFLSLLGIGDGDEPQVTVILPRGVPFHLRGDIGMGESKLELGGLWLTGAALDLGMGEHTVVFGEPLHAPMERLTVNGGMGELNLSAIGNASPERVEVRQRMGALTLDLTGRWQRDADVRTRCSLGECSVRVPDDVGVRLTRARVTIGERSGGLRDRPRPGPDAPELRIDASQSIGELRID
jgi:hypothetical protein